MNYSTHITSGRFSIFDGDDLKMERKPQTHSFFWNLHPEDFKSVTLRLWITTSFIAEMQKLLQLDPNSCKAYHSAFIPILLQLATSFYTRQVPYTLELTKTDHSNMYDLIHEALHTLENQNQNMHLCFEFWVSTHSGTSNELEEITREKSNTECPT
jgi:hypothetical protein